jgi:hypothetical protein
MPQPFQSVVGLGCGIEEPGSVRRGTPYSGTLGCIHTAKQWHFLRRWAVPWLRRLAADLPTRRPRFDPGSVHVGFVVDKVALGQVFLRVLWFSPVNFIPPVLHY